MRLILPTIILEQSRKSLGKPIKLTCIEFPTQFVLQVLEESVIIKMSLLGFGFCWCYNLENIE